MDSSMEKTIAAGFVTRRFLENYSFAWIIKELIDPSCPRQYLSQPFCSGTNNKNIWVLKLTVGKSPLYRSVVERLQNAWTGWDGIGVGVHLELKDCEIPGQAHLVRVTFFMLDKQSEMFNKIDNYYAFYKGQSHGFDSYLHSPRDAERFSHSISKGELTICCDIAYYPVKVNMNIPINTSCGSKDGLANDFQCTLKDGLLSDFTFIVNEHKFHVHKVILASRSPVFRAMFLNDMQEKKSKEVEIPDMTVDTMRNMLSYIYTNQVQNPGEFADELIGVSEKYQLNDLKLLCSTAIGKKLNKVNAIKILILADLYRADELKNQTLLFIVKNIRFLHEMEGYSSLASSRPYLLTEILTFISKTTAR